MVRIILIAVVSLATLPSVVGTDPKFHFVESDTTNRHISVQAKEEYHRVYFILRIENAKGLTAFARVRCKTDGEAEETVQTVRFGVKSDNDLWRVYLRAPRYPDKTAQYQVEVGDYSLYKLDPETVLSAFTWKVVRAPGKVDFVTEEDAGSGQKRAIKSLPITVRNSLVTGGSVKFVFAQKNLINSPAIKFGLDEGPGGKVLVNGSGAVFVK